MKLRDAVIRGGIIAAAIGLLAHFIIVLFLGNILVQEPNLIILSLEIVGLMVIIVFASLNLIRDIRG